MLQMTFNELVQTIIFPALGGVCWYFREQNAQLKEKVNALEANIVHTKNGINQWQIQVVQNYVTKAELERLEHRILSALDRLSDKVEKSLRSPMERNSE
jgi:hypothetical protein